MRELERDPPTDSAIAEAQGAVTPALPTLAIVGAGRVGGSLAGAAGRAGLSATLAGREDALEACRDARGGPALRPRRRDRRGRGGDRGGDPAARARRPHERRDRARRARPGPRRRARPPSPCTRCRRSPTPTPTSPAVRARSPAPTPDALRFARELAERLGMRPFEVAEEHRAAYHAAASIASNFLVALQESAAELLGAAGRRGRPRAARAARPAHGRQLVRARRRRAHRPDRPRRRGDGRAPPRGAARTAPELVALYEALAERTREIAARRAPTGAADEGRAHEGGAARRARAGPPRRPHDRPRADDGRAARGPPLAARRRPASAATWSS